MVCCVLFGEVWSIPLKDLKLRIATVEARFKLGYRFLDRCGSAMCETMTRNPLWVYSQANPQQGLMFDHKHKLSLAMGPENIVISRSDDPEPIALDKALKLIQYMAVEIDQVYNLVTTLFEIQQTIRFGVRFSFTKEMDSLEDVDALLVPTTASDFAKSFASKYRSELCGIDTRFRLQDESGRMQNIRLRSAGRVSPGETPLHGFRGEIANAWLDIDIDSFSRPDENHVEAVEEYVRSRYERVWLQADAIWRSMMEGSRRTVS